MNHSSRETCIVLVLQLVFTGVHSYILNAKSDEEIKVLLPRYHMFIFECPKMGKHYKQIRALIAKKVDTQLDQVKAKRSTSHTTNPSGSIAVADAAQDSTGSPPSLFVDAAVPVPVSNDGSPRCIAAAADITQVLGDISKQLSTAKETHSVYMVCDAVQKLLSVLTPSLAEANFVNTSVRQLLDDMKRVNESVENLTSFSLYPSDDVWKDSDDVWKVTEDSLGGLAPTDYSTATIADSEMVDVDVDDFEYLFRIITDKEMNGGGGD